MKSLPSFVLFFALTALVAGDGETPRPETPQPPPPGGPPAWPGMPPCPRPDPAQGAWLGCILNKPEPSAVAQIPSLPQGMGLVVRGIAPGSPAESAKLELMDVIWKFDDQMLVNQAQLATLLNLKRPGTEVKLGLFRAGQSIEVPIKLGTLPDDSESSYKEWRDRVLWPEGNDRIVDLGERTATYKTDQGKAIVKREGDGYRVEIHDAQDKELLNQRFPADGKWEGVPDGWNRRVWALRHSLDRALDNSLAPVRPPRPRVVPSHEEAVSPPTPRVSPPADPDSAPAVSGGASKH